MYHPPLLYLLLILSVPFILAWFFNQSFSFQHLTDKSFLVTAVSTKLGKTDWMKFTEGITANMFVNIAILGYMLLKEESAKIFIALSAYLYVCILINEHLIANFASFMLLGFNGVRDAVDNFTFGKYSTSVGSRFLR